MASSAKSQVQTLLKIISQAANDALDEYEKYGAAVPSLDSTEPHPLDAEMNQIELKKIIRQLEGACEQLRSTLAPPIHTLVNRAQAYDWACLRVVALGRVVDVLVDKPNGLHVRDLSKVVHIAPSKLATVLRLLATKHCFREVDRDVFANNRLSIAMHSHNPMASFIDMLTLEGPQAASNLHLTLTDPECADSTDPSKSAFVYSLKDTGFQGTVYDWMKLNPERRNIMGKSMAGMNSVMGSLSILQAFPWSKFHTVCDVGSGIGSFAWPLVEKYPNVHVALYDLQDTITQSQTMWESEHPEAVASGRVSFVAGDFFQEIGIKGFDIYYARNIIHNWPDAQALTIMRRLRDAMQPHSRLLVHDYVMQHLNHNAEEFNESIIGLEKAPEPLLPNFGAGQIRLYNQDLTMLFLYNSKERTIVEINELGREADLTLKKVWDLGETSVLEFGLM